MKLIAITGGIGSGKSVVSRLVKVMGYEVYDCDSRAKALMTEDSMVRQQLAEAFGEAMEAAVQHAEAAPAMTADEIYDGLYA